MLTNEFVLAYKPEFWLSYISYRETHLLQFSLHYPSLPA